MNNLTKKDICDKWLINKNINPLTSRKISETGTIYKKLVKKCIPTEKVKLTQKDICDKWLLNKKINPETSRKISETGTIYKKLVKKCLSKSEIKPKSEPKLKSEIKPKSEINSETKKINAVKKIHKLFKPYVKRTSVNIIDRINYFIIMKKYLLSIKEKNNCLRLYNIETNPANIVYRIGRKIILDKKIGTPSAYGIVFLSHFKSNVKYGTKFDKLNKFAIKITNQSADNRKEIKILKKLTSYVIESKCPHFPISYGSLSCDNPNIKSNNSDDYSIVKNKHKNKLYLPEMINKNKSFLIQINELASGDFHSLFSKSNNLDVLNAISQVLISIMFLNNYTNCYHNDAHTGNFLYHKIKPGGYFHYNLYGQDYYLENQGYLWVIWDFGFISPHSVYIKNGTNKIYKPINTDFSIIINAIGYYNVFFKSNVRIFKTLLQKEIAAYHFITDSAKLEELNKKILNFLTVHYPLFTTIKPANIINKNPYIIR
jgi:hypothetical protein